MHAVKPHWRVEVQLQSFLTLALDEGEYSASHSGRFIPGYNPTPPQCAFHRCLGGAKSQVCNGGSGNHIFYVCLRLSGAPISITVRPSVCTHIHVTRESVNEYWWDLKYANFTQIFSHYNTYLHRKILRTTLHENLPTLVRIWAFQSTICTAPVTCDCSDDCRTLETAIWRIRFPEEQKPCNSQAMPTFSDLLHFIQTLLLLWRNSQTRA